ncbi:MAG: PEP-CTERM sorting domain-containing protein [Alphaproteobacteria bacterium]
MFSFASVTQNFGKISRQATVVAALACLSSLFAANAQATVFQYMLHDHPNGTAGTSNYGLRLDGLFGTEHRPFTFSFDAPGTSMLLRYDDEQNSINISGRAYGGMIVGGTWDSTNLGYVDIDFTYRKKVATDGTGTIGTDTANVGLRTTGQDQTTGTGNSGTVTLATGAWGPDADEGDVYTLVDKAAGGFSLKFNNFSDHRLGAYPSYSGPDTFVGWGWVNHWAQGGPPRDHVAASDWLFTGEFIDTTTSSDIPEPSMALVFGLGLVGLTGLRRRGTISAARD